MQVAILCAFRDELVKIAVPVTFSGFPTVDQMMAERAPAHTHLPTANQMFAEMNAKRGVPAVAAAPKPMSNTWMRTPAIQSASPGKVVARFARKVV